MEAPSLDCVGAFIPIYRDRAVSFQCALLWPEQAANRPASRHFHLEQDLKIPSPEVQSCRSSLQNPRCTGVTNRGLLLIRNVHRISRRIAAYSVTHGQCADAVLRRGHIAELVVSLGVDPQSKMFGVLFRHPRTSSSVQKFVS